MANTWQEQLAKVFPGSNTPLVFEEVRKIQEKAIEDWDAKPNIFRMNGKDVEFFSIGQLGKALGNRSSNTLRASGPWMAMTDHCSVVEVSQTSSSVHSVWT